MDNKNSGDPIKDFNAEREEMVKELKKKKKRFSSFLMGLFVFLLLVSLFRSSFYTVPTGEVGIVSRFGEVIRSEGPGLHAKVPFLENVLPMTVKERTVKFLDDSQGDFAPIIASSKDMQAIRLEVTVSNVVTKPLELYKKFTGNHLTSLMYPRIKDAIQSKVSKYTIEEFISERDQLAKDIYEEISEHLSPYGIEITNVSLVNHDFDDEYEQAVKAKKVAQQDVETEKAKQQKLLIEAENRIKLVDLKIKEKMKQGEANKAEALSLTPELLKKMAIEKWDGVLPKAMTGDLSLLFSENDLKTGKLK